MALPLSAVLTGNEGSSARKVEDGVVKFAEVETGIQDGAYIEIVKGLKDGDEVVAKAGAYVRDGDRITPGARTARGFQLKRRPDELFSLVHPKSHRAAAGSSPCCFSSESSPSTALPITRFPNIDVPLVSITVTQSGASPAELEMQVTKEIEDAVASITGVDEIQSTVTDGQSQTVVMFRMEVPTEQAVQDTKDAIDRIRSDLPADVEEPIVTKIDVEGQAIQTFAVSSPDMTLEELSWFVDDTIKRALQGQTGIGRVDRYGGADREVRIELNPDKLNSYGITAADVNEQLRSTNVDLGSGRGQVAGSEQAIRMLGDARNVAELANTTIALPNGRFVKLSELGAINDTYEEPKSFSRFNDTPVVTFGVFRSKGASEVSVAETVAKSLDKVRAENPNVEHRTDRRFRLLHLRQLRSRHPHAARRRAARRHRRASCSCGTGARR